MDGTSTAIRARGCQPSLQPLCHPSTSQCKQLGAVWFLNDKIKLLKKNLLTLGNGQAASAEKLKQNLRQGHSMEIRHGK